MENQVTKYLAIGCFTTIAVLDIFSLRYFNLWLLLTAVGSILVVSALVVSRPAFAATGFALWTIAEVRTLVLLCKWVTFEYSVDFTLIFELVSVITFVLLFVSCIHPKAAKFLGRIAVFAAVIRLILLIAIDGITNFSGIVWCFLLVAGSCFLLRCARERSCT